MPARLVCGNPECTKPGFSCFAVGCNCRIIHHGCKTLIVDPILQDLRNVKVKLPDEAVRTFKTVESIIEKMMGELKIMLDDVDKARKGFGLRKS